MYNKVQEFSSINTMHNINNTVRSNRFKLLTVIVVVFITTYVALFTFPSRYSGQQLFAISLGTENSNHSISIKNPDYHGQYAIETEGCRIKQYHPFDPSVSGYFDVETSPFPSCHDKSFLRAEQNKVFLETDEVRKKFGNKEITCTYQPIIRNPHNSNESADHDVDLGESKPLKFGEPLEDEFIKVECWKEKTFLFEDYLALVFLKPSVEKRCEEASINSLNEDALNVIIIAIDSTSKLNFLRHFPVTNGYLQTTLKPFEFHGHTKVADNTFPNMVPMLTGHFVSYYRKGKAVRNTYYDDIDLVWKKFAEIGYRTHFIEDTPNAGTFSYNKKGFRYPATDYYLRPFAVMAEKTGRKWRTKRGAYCFGHTSETEFFYDYFSKFVKTMQQRSFFAFTFISRTTHTYLNTAGYADKPTFNILKDLYESNVLNRSALIFFSDHGLRFGEILKTYIGKIEERMPFMFQYYPEWFLKKHENFRAALTINQRRLTTPFDVHKTLDDLATVASRNGTIQLNDKDPGFGQSLFTPISPKRTCEDAHISPHWCTCNDRISYDKTDKSVINAAHVLINYINVLTNSINNSSVCKMLQLKDILDSYVSFPKSQSFSDNGILDYLITVEVTPSLAIFEGTVRQIDNKFKQIGEISRVNSYGNQSWCVSDPFLKKYCFC